MTWLIGFGTFIAVTVAAKLGLAFLLDAWWSSDGLDPASRPPDVLCNPEDLIREVFECSGPPQGDPVPRP